jgi:hypothetical protein
MNEHELIIQHLQTALLLSKGEFICINRDILQRVLEELIALREA